MADGDTLTILSSDSVQHRVRLAEIDAPESNQPFGQRSKQGLVSLCFNKFAEVRTYGVDKYRRVLGTVYCDDINANAQQVEHGLAWVYVQYADAESPLFRLEKKARGERVGLWVDAQPVAPWEWRHPNRAPVSSAGYAFSSVVLFFKSLISSKSVRGNSRSRVYHLSHCPSYEAVSPKNQVEFSSEKSAINSGFRKAGNCD